MCEEVLLNKIIEVLPQLQCKKCEYPDCRSYAKSIVEEKEKTNKCEPGGVVTESNIQSLLNDPSFTSEQQTNSHTIADIVREECIGCTICIKVCPVDAIVQCPNFEFSTETREELYYTKEKLLDNGDRLENILAANIKSDNPYR